VNSAWKSSAAAEYRRDYYAGLLQTGQSPSEIIRQVDTHTWQISAAEIRRDIAADSLVVHEKAVEQTQEIFEFLRDRFTNFGRYTYLSAELQKLHRTAFNAALGMARRAEHSCQFEHSHEAAPPDTER
jgi:hypothetical protein